ncbi:glycosyltransferase family protein [Arcobacter sp.]|uniref:glycosyltransferase family protein n=1 Tax=Arcobacter sp. TaxID=1872629 RepID=UPI003C721095
MSYKFLRIGKIYPQFIQDLYRNKTELKNKSYQQQFEYIMNNFFGTADSWEYYLKKLNYETNQVVFNALTLQDTWAKEHNIKKSGIELLYEQIKYYKPEILFIQVASIVNDDFLIRIKKQIKELKLIIIHKSAPITTEELKIMAHADIVLTATEGFRDYFEKQGINSSLIRHAFDPRVLNHINKYKEKINEIVFSGNIINQVDFHNKRLELIESFLNDPSLNLTIYGKIKNSYTYKQHILNQERFGINYYNTLTKYSICLNSHIDIAENYAGNMRMFESTGVGTCLLTDNKSNISKMFLDEEEIVTYNSKNDAIEKAKFLLNNPSISAEIALKGQKRTLKEHTFNNRVLEFDYLVKQNLHN